MSDARLPRAIREHYEGQRLPADKLAALTKQAEAAGPPKSPAPDGASYPWRVLVGFAAAAVLVALGAGWLARAERASLDSMASKIALGHSKNLAAEFPARDFVSLTSRMPKLGFAVAAPRDADVTPLTLVGSRYCSLHQRMAALLKFEDARGRRHTLYQVADDPVFDRADGQTVTRDGLRIRFWREGNVFMGLASPHD